MKNPAKELTLRSRLALAALLLLAACAPAIAGTSPPGVNLRWDQCFGDGGVQFRNFACNTNSGFEQLVASFELASGISGVTGVEFYTSIGSMSATLPAWWQFVNSGTCRQTALAANAVSPPGSLQCVDWAGGLGAGGVAGMVSYPGAPGHTYQVVLGAIAVASSAAANLVAGQEYFYASLRILHTKTVGTGACAGCLDPVCIFASGARIIPGSNPGILLNQPANGSGSQWVSWQQGYPLNIQASCVATGGGLFCLDPINLFDVVPYSTTASHGTSWTRIKSFYR